VDTALEPGERVPPEYDNLIAKLMVHAGDRGAAIDRLRRALDEVVITGIQTTVPFHRLVATSPSFRNADLSTGWVGEHWDGPAEWRAAAHRAQVAAGLSSLSEGHGNPRGEGFRATPNGAALRAASGAEADATDGRWRRAGLERAIDRWPR
jgi:acetyl/propionyl-CoA carboxylase alpha subunit